jgi:hypothetical protein
MKFEFLKLNGIYATSRSSANAETTGKSKRAVDNLQAKQLRDMQDALQRMQAMPSPQNIAKQEAMNRVGMLKQRIDALKELLLYASPEQAKALARELKSIAAELSSVANSLGTSSGQGAAPNTAQLNPIISGTQLSESSTAAAGVNVAPGEADSATSTTQETDSGNNVEHGDDGKTKVGGASVVANASGRIDSGDKHSAQDGDESALKTLLLDARKLLKEAIGMMKSKLASAGKGAKHDMQAAEKSLVELDKALSQEGGNDFYTGRGDLSASTTGGSTPASLDVSGLNINLAA